MTANNGDPPKRPEAVEFIDLIAQALGIQADDVSALSEATGTEKRDIYRYRAGQHAPSLRVAIEMLKRARLLRPVEEAAAEVAAQPTVDSRLAALEARIDELPTADDLRRGFESLRRSIAQASQGTGEAQPASRRDEAR